MNESPSDTAGVIAPPPLIFAVPLIIGILGGRRWPATFLPPRLARPLGLLLVLCGGSLQLWFLRTMRHAQTPIIPTQPTTALVTDGPFQLTRNPAYLGFTLIYTGSASLANSRWAMLLLPAALAVMRRGVIEREERYLERKFGAKYRRYKIQVRRWI